MCKYSLATSVNVSFVILQVEKTRKYMASIKITACDFVYKLINQALSLVIRWTCYIFGL